MEPKFNLGDRVFDTTLMQFMMVDEVRVFINPGNNQPAVMYRVVDLERPGQFCNRMEEALEKSPEEAMRGLNNRLQQLIKQAEAARMELEDFLGGLEKARHDLEGAAAAQDESEKPAPPTEENQEMQNDGKRHYKTRRTLHHWKTDEGAFALDLAEKGVPFSGIADALQNKYGFRVSAAAVRARLKQ